jgi:hypothetical protein
MKLKSLLQIEWISLVYLGLFVLAVLSPSLVTHGFFGIEEKSVEEFLIFLFGIVGLVTFSIYQRLMEHKDKEHQDAKNEYERARRELVDSYQYIGSINRKLEVLKGLANQTSLKIVESNHLSKGLLSSLLASAVASVGARTAIIRYLDLEKLRTEHEIVHMPDSTSPLKVANKELKKLHDTGAAHAFIMGEDAKEILVVPSDHKDKAVKAFLLIATDPSQSTASIDTSLLKVFANQAELLHYTLAEHVRPAPSPLELVEQTERQAVGEVQ